MRFAYNKNASWSLCVLASGSRRGNVTAEGWCCRRWFGRCCDRHAQPKRNFAHALGHVMDREASGPRHELQSQDTPGRGLPEKESKLVGHGCDCQLGDMCGSCPCPYLGLTLAVLAVLAPGQVAAAQTQKASTCFFSGSAVPPPNSNNWTAGRSRRSTAYGHWLGSVISHIPSTGHSLRQATSPSLHCRRRRQASTSPLILAVL